MKTKRTIFIIFLLFLFTSCTNKKTSQQRIDKKKESVTWFYFSENGIHQANTPSSIPQREFKPWTESLRASDISFIHGNPAILINKLGLMVKESNSNRYSIKFDSAFSNASAGGIYNTNLGTAIRFYTDINFADKTQVNNSIFLASFNENTGSFSVLMEAKDFGLSNFAQCIELNRINSKWYAAFKDSTDSKIEFNYFEFSNFPIKKEIKNKDIKKISNETYQNIVKPLDLNLAPEQIQDLIKDIPVSDGIEIKIISKYFKSSQIYKRSGINDNFEAFAVITDNKSALLFTDGTLFYKSDNYQKTKQTIKLPKLAKGYIYTGIIFSGSSFLISWEEQRFFEVGRAGLLEINIPNEL